MCVLGKFKSIITREGLPAPFFECFERRCEEVLAESGLFRVDDRALKREKAKASGGSQFTSYLEFFEFVFQTLGECLMM